MAIIKDNRVAKRNFPPFPRNSGEIWAYEGSGEYMACSIVGNRTTRQLMAYRRLRQRLGEQRFREQLIEGLDILSRSTGITTPAGWLYAFLDSEAAAS